ncbi:LAME_0H11914g1_1 [Lachancea meyersii CBS 8951]|uniref:LAME_0H11914g1_1 n=1 Tax=Lachancea meyersii CBS 8951 TaxID=1266667 RepID=A0A1G4KGJ7_9SACH|nr:LAME_0H11914g1_1 [Lachancea meyersii CBS 8951]
MRFQAVFWLLSLVQSIYCLQWDEIIHLRDQDGLIEVTDDNYDVLSKGSRPFYSILYVTTSQTNSNGEKCDLCDEFEANVRKVSRAMLDQLSEEINQDAFFFKLDVSHCKSFVQEMGLKTIPHLLVYPPHPKDGNFSWTQNQFFQYKITAETSKDPLKFAHYLAKILNVYIQMALDFDITEFSYYFVASLAAFYTFKKKILPRISRKGMFFSLCFSLAIILTSITGYKFTQMNNIPLIARNQDGRIMFFSGGMGWQFGIEILTVTGMYMWLGGSFVGMILLPRLKLRPVTFNVTAFTLLVFGAFGFVYFIECFRIKQPDYPFGM